MPINNHDARINIRVSSAQKAAWYAAAEKKRLWFAEWLRKVADEAAAES